MIIGAADGVIIATIITHHMRRVKATSSMRHAGLTGIVIAIACAPGDAEPFIMIGLIPAER